MTPSLARVVLYVKDIPKVAHFYQRHFGLLPLPSAKADWLELAPPSGGCAVALHQAAKSQKSGAAMKLVFGVRDVRGFVARSAPKGLKFGPVHAAPGFEFANGKDPAGNAISISNRGLG
jgi:hypothetical protein